MTAATFVRGTNYSGGPKRRVLFVADGRPNAELVSEIARRTQSVVDVLYIDASLSSYKEAVMSRFHRHLTYLRLAIGMARRQSEYGLLVASQQFIGWYWSALGLSRWNSPPPLLVLTFIYLRRPGPLGHLYERFIRQCLRTPSLGAALTYSSEEAAHYRVLFPDSAGKIRSVPLGVSFPVPTGPAPGCPSSPFFFSGGSSNRDYATLAAAARSVPAPIVVACRPQDSVGIDWPSNVVVRHDLFGEDFRAMARDAVAVVVPLRDPRISTGLLTLLLAMQIGQTIVATKSAGVVDYVNEHSAFLVGADNVSDLARRMSEVLDRPEEARRKGKVAKADYVKHFTSFHYSAAVGGIGAELLAFS